MCGLHLAAHLNSGAEFSSDILDPCLDFLKFMFGEVNSDSQLVPAIVNRHPVTETHIHFYIN